MNTTQRLTAYAMQNNGRRNPTPAQRRRLIKKARNRVVCATPQALHISIDDRLWMTGGPKRAA